MENVSELAKRLAEEITRRTTIEHYRLVLNEERQPNVTDSKIGGKPYWPAGKDFPVDDQGTPMLMVMQVNCEEAGLKAPLPEHGMLQWFIGVNPDRMYGCQGNFNEDGTGVRIIYHESIEESALLGDVPTHETVDNELTPVKREVAIDTIREETAMGVSDGHFNRLFFDIVKEITGVEQKDIVLALSLAYAVYVGRHLYDPAFACILTGANRVEVAVGVIDMKNHKMFLFGSAAREGHHCDQRENNIPFHLNFLL